jgi:hypothetical protein
VLLEVQVDLPDKVMVESEAGQLVLRTQLSPGYSKMITFARRSQRV